MPMIMSSFKPYLFRAYYDWFVDNGITPHLLVSTEVKGVQVPQEYVKDGYIVLSIAPKAIADYRLRSGGISFKAMFHGRSEDIYVPYKAMSQLIAAETGVVLPLTQVLNAQAGSDDEDDADDIFADDGAQEETVDFANLEDNASAEEDLLNTLSESTPTIFAEDDHDDNTPAFEVLTEDDEDEPQR